MCLWVFICIDWNLHPHRPHSHNHSHNHSHKHSHTHSYSKPTINDIPIESTLVLTPVSPPLQTRSLYTMDVLSRGSMNTAATTSRPITPLLQATPLLPAATTPRILDDSNSATKPPRCSAINARDRRHLATKRFTTMRVTTRPTPATARPTPATATIQCHCRYAPANTNNNFATTPAV